MFKKSLVLIAAVVLIAAMFAGCGMGGNDVRINETSDTPFDSVSITTSSTRVVFAASDRYGVDIVVPERFAPEWYVADGRLTIRDKTNNYSIGWNVFPRNYYIKVYYPAGTNFADIAILSASGRVEIPQLNVAYLNVASASGRINAGVESFEFVSLSAASGDITFSGSGGSAVIVTQSGTVRADMGDCEAMSVETASGRISLTGSGDTATMLSVSTMSGRVDAKGGAWQDATVRTSSGNTTISGEMLGDTYVETSSGSVQISVNGSPSAYGYSLTPSSGSIRWNGERMARPALSSGAFDNHITVTTASGGIRVDFANR